MIDITRLYCGIDTENKIRYTKERIRPVVVWNITKKCNLSCIYCYSATQNTSYHKKKELDYDDCKNLIDDLANYNIPMLLLSGGEPLMRKDFYEIAEQGKRRGLKVVLSTNGTLIDTDVAKKLRDVGISYVGISIDGIGKKNDLLRGKAGAYASALKGIRNCKREKMKVGLRFTITKNNFLEIKKIFQIVKNEKIDRLCFYHLVYSGRGKPEDDLGKEQKRKTINIILDETLKLCKNGSTTEVLTVGNPADGPYIYMKLLKNKLKDKAEKALQLLSLSSGIHSTGMGIGCIDPYGFVHPDQFWDDCNLGNVKKKRFSEIWEKSPLLLKLRNRQKLLKGRCEKCKWLWLCGGGNRVRAKYVYNDIWASDPACYLNDNEI
ncbi:MAG: radical SAM protein [Candidatus Thermoplasmatota archaeon]